MIVRFWLFSGDLRRARHRHLLCRLPPVRARVMRAPSNTTERRVRRVGPEARDHAPLRGNCRRAWCRARSRRDGPNAMTAVTPRVGMRFNVPRFGRQLAEKTPRPHCDDLAPPADLRRAVRDGRGAERRRSRHDPVGVVGRRAEQLRLVVVLLQPAARLGARRRGRVRRRRARRLPRLATLRALAPRSSRSCSSSPCSCPASASWSTGRAVGSGTARCACSRARSPRSRCCSSVPTCSLGAPNRLADWRAWSPVLLGLRRAVRSS